MFDDIIDLVMTSDGDLMLNDSGDLATVSGYELISQEINKIVKTVNPEWLSHPRIGSDLNRFRGMSNTRILGKKIEDSLRKTINDQFPSFGITVRVLPISNTSISIYMSMLNVGYNTMESIYNFSFDFINGDIIANTNKDTDTISHDTVHSVPDNKYLNRGTVV